MRDGTSRKRRRPVHRTIVLVRHGQFTKSTLGLTALGRRQADRTARRLLELPVTSIHSSTMPRAYETAQILARAHSRCGIRRAHLLRECLPSMLPRFRGASYGETAAMVRAGRSQAHRAYRRYFRPPGTRDRLDILVSHGNLIRYLVGRVLGLGPHGWYDFGTHHCGITVIRISSERRRVVDVYNDTGHLPLRMRTTGTRTDP